MTPEQRNLLQQTIQQLVQASIFRAVWGLPVWMAAAVGAVAFGLLYAMAS